MRILNILLIISILFFYGCSKYEMYDWAIESNRNSANLELKDLKINYLNKEHSEVSVLVVDEETMSTLHSKHSGIDETTDVLTFDHGSDEHAVRADIAVCGDVALLESEKHNTTIQNELLLYILHGILHCCGFDDCDDESHQKIHAEEDRVLKAIGVGTVWSNVT